VWVLLRPTNLDALDELMQEEAGAVVLEVGSAKSPSARAVGVTIRAVAATFEPDRVTFACIDADQYPELAAEFKVRCVPTILFMLDGEILDAAMGKIDPTRLHRRVDWLIDRAEGEGFFARLLRRRA
jgi:thioredoxin-like negative regulator of GroEL